MYKLLTKNGQLFAFGLGALITVVFLLLIFSGLEDFNLLDKDTRITSDIFNFGMYAGIALVAICALSMLAFGVIQIASNPKGSLKGLIGIVAIIVIFFIAKSIGTGESAPDLVEAMSKNGVTESVGANISGAILLTALVGGIAVAALVVSEVRNFFK